MKILTFVCVAILTMVSFRAIAATRIKIASVAPEYRPTAGAEVPEPVQMQGFAFEIRRDLKQARLVVDYTYPDQAAFGASGGLGPAPAKVEIPGLHYDAEAHTVVFESDGTKTVCATVQSHRSLFRSVLVAKPTGSCLVTSSLSAQAGGEGWAIRRTPTLDTYLEIR